MAQGFQAAPQQRSNRRHAAAEVVRDLRECLAAALLKDDHFALRLRQTGQRISQANQLLAALGG
jgi:hypothetical protein